VSTFTAELAIKTSEYDIPTDPPAVKAAARHLCDFRTGYSEVLYRLSCDATQFLYDDGLDLLEPALRVLGTEHTLRTAARLYRIASDVTRTDRLDGGPDLDEAERTLRVVCAQAADAVAMEIYRDNRICCDATKETR
jgi:hypothetical protein